MRKLTREEIESDYSIEVSAKDTVPYQYTFFKHAGKVYRASKIADEDWRVEEMPFICLPI